MPFYLMCTLFITVVVVIWIKMINCDGDHDSESAAWGIVLVEWCVIMVPLLIAAW